MGSGGSAEHSRIVEAEFARQAQAFAGSPDLRAPEVTVRIVEALADFDAERILDVACGPGVLTPALCTRARHVVGLDLTQATLRLARQQAPEPPKAAFVRSLAETAPFADGCFDAAVLRLALHHVEHPADVLGEVRRLLRHGGRLVVLDILTSPVAAVAELHNAIERLRDPSHTSLVSRDELRDQILAAGFSLESQRSWQSQRSFEGWARIISENRRMAALEVVLRQLAAADVGAGIDLREQDGEVWFTYEWGLFVAEARGA